MRSQLSCCCVSKAVLGCGSAAIFTKYYGCRTCAWRSYANCPGRSCWLCKGLCLFADRGGWLAAKQQRARKHTRILFERVAIGETANELSVPG